MEFISGGFAARQQQLHDYENDWGRIYRNSWDNPKKSAWRKEFIVPIIAIILV
jgi:hypothetical protein